MGLNVVQYEDIAALLREVPPLVDRLEARQAGFADEVLAWLKRTEVTLEGNRLPLVSQISSCRAQLIQAGRGVQLGELTFVGRPTARKVRDATASLALQRGNDLLHGAIAEREAAFGEAERLARQVLAVAQAKGLVGASDGRPHQQRLSEIDRRIATDPDLASGYVHLVALVGKTDVLIFLDRALSGLE